jgi:dihydropteroate synthase
MQFWQTSRRQIAIDRPLVMGILNVTPDSFSDGGRYSKVDLAVERAEEMIAEGVDIIDIGGESTRPGSSRVDAETEIQRTVPIVEAIVRRFDIPMSIDTSKSDVAKALIDHGAEIINDISGLRWDASIADIAAQQNAGLVLMHSRGTFETMHSEPPVADVLDEVERGLGDSLSLARNRGVNDEQIVLDIGIGFGKTVEQNLELIAKLDRIRQTFEGLPLLVGASRKSFIGKVLGGVPPDERIYGSVAVAAAAVTRGAKILRVHDVKATVDAVTIARELII